MEDAQLTYWTPIKNALDIIWAALSREVPTPVTAAFLSALYSKIVALCGRNFLSFFRVVYGDWSQQSQSNELHFSGELSKWASERFQQQSTCCLGQGVLQLKGLSQLSRSVYLLQKICTVVFSVPDKQRLDRSRMLFGGSALSVGEIIELVFWHCVIRNYQHQLFSFACQEIDRLRSGDFSVDQEALWGTLRYFRTVPPSLGSLSNGSPALHKVREERSRLYKDLVLTTYCDAMLKHLSSVVSPLISTEEMQAFAVERCLQIVEREEGFLRSSHFPAEYAANVMFTLIRTIANRYLTVLFNSSKASPASLLVEGDWRGLALYWDLVKHFISYDVHRGALLSRQLIDSISAEQSAVMKAFAEKVREGCLRSCFVILRGERRGLGEGEAIKETLLSLCKWWQVSKTFASKHFVGYGLLVECFRSGLKEAVNAHGTALASPAKAISNTINTIMISQTDALMHINDDRSDNGGHNSEEGDGWRQLDHLCELATFLSSLDTFGLEMRHSLAQRLLRRSDTVSLDRERSLASRLKAYSVLRSIPCMPMIDDVAKSRHLETSFATFSEAIPKLPPVQVLMLKKINWSPFVNCYQFRNALLCRLQHHVGLWYRTVHGSAQIESALEVTIAIQFANSKRLGEFTGRKSHVIEVLLAVSRALTPPTIAEVASMLGVAPRAVGMAASFLRARGAICALGRVPSLTDATPLRIDSDCVPRSRKINIDPPPSKDETQALEGRFESELTQLRKHQIQIALVRVMKRRKDESVPHDELIAETLRLISSFNPPVVAIKGQIEELIRKDIMERDAFVCGAYRYRL